MTTHLVPVNAGSANDKSYGITWRSMYVYRFVGPHLHNPRAPHRIQVWDNTGRLNTEPDTWNQHSGKPGPGKYLDPSGRGTDSAETVTTSAEATAITNNGTNTGTVASGQVYADAEPRVGDFVVLVYPGGLLSDPYVVTSRPLNDPYLAPVCT